MSNKSDSPDDFPDVAVEEMLSTRLALSSVTISGAERTSRSLLDRLTSPVLSTGGTFSSVVEDVSKVVDLLRATNCYRGVDAFLDTSSDSSASATFTVSEKSLYQLHTGTTIDTSPGARRDPTIEASFVWRNLSGQADSLKAAMSWMGGAAGEAFAARPTNRIQLDYTRPFAFGRQVGFFANFASSLHNHEHNSSHSLRLRNAQAGVDHPFGRLSLIASWRNVLDIDDRASPIVHHNAGHSWKTSVQQAIELDRRDSPRMPTNGDYLSITAEATLPFGDVRFAKFDTAHQVHLPIGSSGVSAAFFSRTGAIVSQSRTSIVDRFYLGGPTSFRGFNVRGIGPRDQTDAIGGDIYYTLGAMLSVPVPQPSLLSQLFNARLHIFGTVGDLSDISTVQKSFSSISEKPLSQRAGAAWEQLYESMRVSAGLGVALQTAVGRIEFNFCRILRSSDTDAAVSGFQFNISESFS